MIRINNLVEAKCYAEQNSIRLIEGYSIKREDNSEECVAIFEEKKPLFCSFDSNNSQEIDPQNILEKRNITLWNKIHHLDDSTKRIILTSFYIFSSIILFPVVDWAIGHLRSDQEILSIYRNDTDPSTPQKSAIIEHQRINPNASITCKYTTDGNKTTMDYQKDLPDGGYSKRSITFSNCNIDPTNRESLMRLENFQLSFSFFGIRISV